MNCADPDFHKQAQLQEVEKENLGCVEEFLEIAQEIKGEHDESENKEKNGGPADQGIEASEQE